MCRGLWLPSQGHWVYGLAYSLLMADLQYYLGAHAVFFPTWSSCFDFCQSELPICALWVTGKSFQAKSSIVFNLALCTFCFLLAICFLCCLCRPVSPLKQHFWFFKAGRQEAWWFGLFPGKLVLAPPSLSSSKHVCTLNYAKGNHLFQMSIIKERTQASFSVKSKVLLSTRQCWYWLCVPIHSLRGLCFHCSLLMLVAGNTKGIHVKGVYCS